MHLCGSSDFFGEMMAANPSVIRSLGVEPADCLRRDYRAILRATIDAESSFPAEIASLRLKWAQMITEIGALDASNQISIFDTNRLQTELAIASLNVSFLVARREMARRYGPFRAGPRMAFFGLGRLIGGVDYSLTGHSCTYDSLVPSPVQSLTQDGRTRAAELMTRR